MFMIGLVMCLVGIIDIVLYLIRNRAASTARHYPQIILWISAIICVAGVGLMALSRSNTSANSQNRESISAPMQLASTTETAVNTSVSKGKINS